MGASLQTIDHNFPEDIDVAIADFKKAIIPCTKKSLIKTFSQVVSIQTNKNANQMYTTTESQIKKSLEIGPKEIFGIKYNKKLNSYSRDEIIQSFKKKLQAVSNATVENNQDISLELFLLISNLALYLSHSGTFITKQDYYEMDQIIQSKGSSFCIGVLEPELSDNIDRNTHSMKDRGRKKIGISIHIPEITIKKRYNNEDIPTLTKLSEGFIQENKQKLLQGENEKPKNQRNENTPEDLRKQIIKNESDKFAGYYSIGGKIHFEKSISEEKINEFRTRFGFNSTCFQLIHANSSLLLPPSCSPNILLYYILALEKFGLIEGKPDLQLSIPGRLPNRAAGILGSMVLLSGDTHTEYPPEAFSTSQHNEKTGARIMAYDAGVLNNKFKHNSSKLVGRTDMLGIVDLNTTYTYHLAGSIISQAFYGGKYSKIGKEFIKEYVEILKKYSLETILEEGRIYDETQDTIKSSELHYKFIKSITDLQKQNREQFQESKSIDGLIVFEIKNLLNKYKERLNYKK